MTHEIIEFHSNQCMALIICQVQLQIKGFLSILSKYGNHMYIELITNSKIGIIMVRYPCTKGTTCKVLPVNSYMYIEGVTLH